MTHQTEDSPVNLATPKPNARRLNNSLLVIGGAVCGALGLLLIFSIFAPVPEPGKETKNQQAATQAREAKPLTEIPEGSGLAAAPKSDKLPVAATGTPIPVQPAPLSPQMQARLQELEQLRRLRLQLQLQALQAPLAIEVGNRPQPVAVQTPAQVVLRPGQAADQRPDPRATENDRLDKEGFATRSARSDQWRLGHSRESGALCEIKTGTVIPGIMLTGINSDLPGQIIAQVSQHVYDTATGSMLVIPQGSRLFGMYDSRVAVGQSRVLIAWNRIIFPDGSSVTLESMPGADQAGYSGFTDDVDNHYFRIFGSAIIMSLISGSMAYTMDSLSGTSGSTEEKPTMQNEMGTALAGQLGQASIQLLQQNVNIKPTLGIRPGYRFNLVLVRDIAFDRPYTPAR